MSTSEAERIQLQRCTECETWNIPELVRCPNDPGHQLMTTTVSGVAAVFSYTVTHIAMRESARAHTPYVTTLVELAEGPRLPTHFAGQLDLVRIGLAVRVHRVTVPTPHMPEGALLAIPLEQAASDV